MLPAAALDLIRRHRHVNVALIDQALVSGTSFLSQILLVRALGLDAFGRFTLAWMAVLFAQGLQTALIVRPMMAVGPQQEPADRPGYYGAVMAQQAVLGAALAGLLLIGTALASVLFPEWGARPLIVPLALACLAHLAQDLLRRLLFTRGRALLVLACDGLRSAVLLAGLALLLTLPAPTSALTLWVHAAASLAGGALALPLLPATRLETARLRPVALRHWTIARWLAGSVLLEWTQGHLLTIIAAAVLGAGAAGAIRATQNVVGITHILFEGLQNVVPIHAAERLRDGGVPALRAYTLRAVLAMAAAVGAILLAVVLVPGFWLRLFYGPALLGYERLLYWHSLVYLLMVPGLPMTAALGALERTRHVFLAMLAGSIVTPGAGYPLALALGLDGIMLTGSLIQLCRQLVLLRGLARELPLAAAPQGSGG